MLFLDWSEDSWGVKSNLVSYIRKPNYSVFYGFTSSICYLLCDIGEITLPLCASVSSSVEKDCYEE